MNKYQGTYGSTLTVSPCSNKRTYWPTYTEGITDSGIPLTSVVRFATEDEHSMAHLFSLK